MFFGQTIEKGDYVRKIVVAHSGVDGGSIKEDGVQELFADLAVGEKQPGLADDTARL